MDPAVIRRSLDYMGIGAPLGLAFCALLPGPDGRQDRHPSATVCLGANAVPVYHDWRDGTILLLPELYASLHHGRSVHLNPPSVLTWQLRLLVEAGILKPSVVEAPALPATVNPTLKRLFVGFVFLLACKWIHDYGEPSAYSARFAAAWCGVSKSAANRAIAELVSLGYLVPVFDADTEITISNLDEEKINYHPTPIYKLGAKE